MHAVVSNVRSKHLAYLTAATPWAIFTTMGPLSIAFCFHGFEAALMWASTASAQDNLTTWSCASFLERAPAIDLFFLATLSAIANTWRQWEKFKTSRIWENTRGYAHPPFFSSFLLFPLLECWKQVFSCCHVANITLARLCEVQLRETKNAMITAPDILIAGVIVISGVIAIDRNRQTRNRYYVTLHRCK